MMNAITIRNLSDAATQALEARAAENGTTAEIEAERILQEALAVVPDTGNANDAVASGEDLIIAFQKLREDYPELDDIEFTRDQTPARAASFE